jgi:hypothetical protein
MVATLSSSSVPAGASLEAPASFISFSATNTATCGGELFMSPKQKRRPSVPCKIIGIRDPLSVILIPVTSWSQFPPRSHYCCWSPKIFFAQFDVMDELELYKNLDRQHYFVMHARVPLSLIHELNPSWSKDSGFSDIFINKFERPVA